MPINSLHFSSDFFLSIFLILTYPFSWLRDYKTYIVHSLSLHFSWYMCSTLVRVYIHEGTDVCASKRTHVGLDVRGVKLTEESRLAVKKASRNLLFMLPQLWNYLCTPYWLAFLHRFGESNSDPCIYSESPLLMTIFPVFRGTGFRLHQ